MSEEEIRIEIAKLCGWRFIDDHYGWQMSNGACVGPLLNYTQSLDACAQMEATIKGEQDRRMYCYFLVHEMKPGEFTFMAPALQRSKAFLAFHKWKAKEVAS